MLVSELDSILPGFAAYYQSDENLFDTRTSCAVFAACSHFVWGQPVADEAWSRLAAVVNRDAAGSDEVASEAACTCLLENLADPSHPLKRYLEGDAIRYWIAWE
ncbi:MAG TPA: hypothetical protein VER96_31690 [Polyangiaceae bacterium]|nr:hypothetical protein [Polyangiaceae bacterium]